LCDNQHIIAVLFSGKTLERIAFITQQPDAGNGALKHVDVELFLYVFALRDTYRTPLKTQIGTHQDIKPV